MSCVPTDFNELRMKGAVFSDDRVYRYALYRKINGTAGYAKPCVFIMLNPSTADEKILDPTIRRCRNFALDWGCTELYIGNLFAYRTPYPAQLKAHRVGNGDIVGVGNMDWLRALADVAKEYDRPGPIVAAWGPTGRYMDQDETVRGWLSGYEVMCLGTSKDGSPRHPLMMPKDAQLRRYEWRSK